MNLWRFAKFSQYDDRKWSKVTSKVDYFWVNKVKKVLKGLFWDKNARFRQNLVHSPLKKRSLILQISLWDCKNFDIFSIYEKSDFCTVMLFLEVEFLDLKLSIILWAKDKSG